MGQAPTKAEFNRMGEATKPGWATYHQPSNQRRALRCRVLGHKPPRDVLELDGISPRSYGMCYRCGNFMKFYVVGQHRYGGINEPKP